jgi:hypothetical protein
MNLKPILTIFSLIQCTHSYWGIMAGRVLGRDEFLLQRLILYSA